jgi:flagellar motility protein MotE (MotC chaperone)
MNLRRILRIKEIEERDRARRLKEIDETIQRLEEEKKKFELELSECQKMLESSSDALRLIFRQRAFVSKINELDKKVKDLEKRKEEESENLKEIKREEKAVKILKEKVSYEEYSRNLKREFLQVGFIHLLKKGLKVLLPFVFIGMGLTFGESAVQTKLKEDVEKEKEERLREVEKVIERKLQQLIEERKKLEALRKRPLTEEEEKEVKKLIKIVSKTPSDEAGAILNNLKPRIAAEILIRLKARQAGQILAAMDPQKAARVTEIIMSWRANAKKR